jgi:hypothetical protein
VHLLSLVGWALIGIGVAGRIWCASYICDCKNKKLVMGGPYSICRNPLYFSSFIAGLGVMLLTGTFLLPVLFTLLFWAYYPGVTAREEAMLLRLHGAAFEGYRSRVPRFLPNPRLFSEPAGYMASAARFRKSLTEVVWFFIAGGVVEFLRGMHLANYLPTLLYLY